MILRLLIAAIVLCLSGCHSAPEISRAAYLGDTETVNSLLKSGANINKQGLFQPIGGLSGTTVLAAAAGGHIPTLDAVLKNGGDLGDRFTHVRLEGGSALHAAVHGNHVPMTKHLLDLGLDVNEHLADKWSVSRNPALRGTDPLGIAIVNGNLEIARLLLNAGSNVNARYYIDGTPLMLAAEYGHNDIVSELITAGADPNLVDSRGGNALGQAAFKGNVEAMEALLGNGAAVDAADQYNPGIRAFVQHFAADFLASSEPQKSIELYNAAMESYSLGIDHYKKEARWDAVLDVSAWIIANTASVAISEHRASGQARAVGDVASLQNDPPSSITYIYTIPLSVSPQWDSSSKQTLARCKVGQDRVRVLLDCYNSGDSSLPNCMKRATEQTSETGS